MWKLVIVCHGTKFRESQISNCRKLENCNFRVSNNDLGTNAMFFGTPSSSVKYNFLYSGLKSSYLLDPKQAWPKIAIHNQKKKLKVSNILVLVAIIIPTVFFFFFTLFDIVSFREKCSYFLLLCMVERNSLLHVLSKWQTGRFLHHCTS